MGRIETVLETFNTMYPKAYCELNHTNALELLIAVMLSAQSTDISVNKLTKKLFQKYQSLDDFLTVPTPVLEQDLRQIGLYKNKAKSIKNTCLKIKNEFNGKVPASQEALESLPGVGRKTANVVLSVWYDVPRIAVDTHVERVSKRLKLAYNNDTTRKVEDTLMRKIPKNLWSKTHHQMIFFGRYHCKSQKPHCEKCPLKELCRYPNI